MSARLDFELSARRAKQVAEMREEGLRMAEICAALGITMRQAAYAEKQTHRSNTHEQRISTHHHHPKESL